MLTRERMAKTLDRIKYKPDYVLAIVDIDPIQDPHLFIHSYQTNSYNPDGDKVELRIFTPVPYFGTEEAFIAWVLHRLKAVELHELLEWFKVDGKPWIDPHRAL